MIWRKSLARTETMNFVCVPHENWICKLIRKEQRPFLHTEYIFNLWHISTHSFTSVGCSNMHQLPLNYSYMTLLQYTLNYVQNVVCKWEDWLIDRHAAAKDQQQEVLGYCYLLCGLVQIQRSGFDFRSYQIFCGVVGLERGPLSLVRTTEELLGRHSSGFSLEIQEYGRGESLRWPRKTHYQQNFALT
jgi:hypothetical protein